MSSAIGFVVYALLATAILWSGIDRGTLAADASWPKAAAAGAEITLSPSSGAPGTLVTVFGNDFEVTSRVRARATGGSVDIPISTTLVSRSILRFRVPILASCGSLDVSVRGLAPDSGVASETAETELVTFTVTAPCAAASAPVGLLVDR